MKCWQDLAKTIPAVNNGDPVAVMECSDPLLEMQQANPACRPIISGGLPTFVVVPESVQSLSMVVPGELDVEKHDAITKFLMDLYDIPRPDPKPDHIVRGDSRGVD